MVKVSSVSFYILLLIVGLSEASTSNKSATTEVDDILTNLGIWGDTIIAKIRKMFDDFTDFDALSQIIDATIEEDCYIEDCPEGEIRQPNLEYVPESNGCGSFGLQVRKDLLPDEGLENCCELHDYCYDSCGVDRDVCDLNFKTCLYSVCKTKKDHRTNKELKGCKAAAKFMYTATQAFGCKPYQDSQKKACQCQRVENKVLQQEL